MNVCVGGCNEADMLLKVGIPGAENCVFYKANERHEYPHQRHLSSNQISCYIEHNFHPDINKTDRVSLKYKFIVW